MINNNYYVEIIIGAKAVVMSELFGVSALPFFLDDVGCSGSESNILDCLPQHNCHINTDGTQEAAGVQCLRKGRLISKPTEYITISTDFESACQQCLGVKLEQGSSSKQEFQTNNSLITVTDDSEQTLLCSTDRDDCCTDEFNAIGNWFLPNGSKILPRNSTTLFHITLGNQTVGLNGPELPSGIYHCEMMDRENITHHLYAGIYSKDEGILDRF